MTPLLQATRQVPIVFVNVSDPVGAGFVTSLARPGGNATGFTQFEYGTSGKWLELLKQIAPGLKHAGGAARSGHPHRHCAVRRPVRVSALAGGCCEPARHARARWRMRRRGFLKPGRNQ
jgi:ABC-type uncharacterized transport system substrate-binding protein